MTAFLVTLIPTLKLSSTFPLNMSTWSSGHSDAFSTSRSATPGGSENSDRNRALFSVCDWVSAGKSESRALIHRRAVERKGRRMRILGRVNPWSRGSDVEAEGREAVEVLGMGTGAGSELGSAEAALAAFDFALVSDRAAASWASFSFVLRIRRRVLGRANGFRLA